MDPFELDDDRHLRKITSYNSGELFFPISIELKSSAPAKAGGSKVIEVLDTLGTSMLNWYSLGKFVSNTSARRSKISILAFEVANTIAKGSNLMQSLSKENTQILKKEILHSEGVQLLVSTDMKKLLSIAAADKREELEVFARDVVRFGDMCIDPQWHHLDRFFVRLDLDLVTNKRLREEAVITMQELANLSKHTFELYHECEALGRLDQFYWRRRQEVEALHLPRKGESLTTLKSELKHQRKLVRNLQKKSLWSKSFEEVVEKLVDVVVIIHQAIFEAFEEKATSSTTNGEEVNKEPERLGVAGLALHYANLITQISCIASRPTSLTPNMRDKLYNGLPANVKSDLRSILKARDSPKVMTVPQIKAEMDITLNWLIPIANDTTKAHHSFGFVGEWGNTGNEFGTNGSNNIVRLQTLYHADKQKMDRYILDLVIWLHRLISLTGYKDDASPTSKGLNLHSDDKHERIQISSDDKNLLEKVPKQRMMVPGVSISLEQVLLKKKHRRGEVFASSRSM